MSIVRIRVANFKSFKDLDIELGRFNVIVGANASGKSNFVQLFRLLRDIESVGVDNAVSLQGGPEYLTNVKIGKSENFSLTLTSDERYGNPLIRIRGPQKPRVTTFETTYGFSLKFQRGRHRLKVSEDTLVQKFYLTKGKEKTAQSDRGEVVFSQAGGKISVSSLTQPADGKYRVAVSPNDLRYLTRFRERLGALPLLESFLPFFLARLFTAITILDIDTKLPKQAVPITSKADLQEDGSNLAIVLKDVLAESKRRKQFSNLITEILPFVKRVGVERFTEKQLMLSLRETYFVKPLPASLLSDGTISVTALILALYFERHPMIVIEEPERNLHPSAISKVVSMMKDAARMKQVIVTTHSPEMVRHAGLDNLLLISRDRDGFSTIIRPREKPMVQEFLKQQMGLEELYAENLLESLA